MSVSADELPRRHQRRLPHLRLPAPHVGEAVPFEDAPGALRLFQRGLTIGKLARAAISGAGRTTSLTVTLSRDGSGIIADACRTRFRAAEDAEAFLSSFPEDTNVTAKADKADHDMAELFIGGRAFRLMGELGDGTYGLAMHYKSTGKKDLHLAVKFFRKEEYALEEMQISRAMAGSKCGPVVSRLAEINGRKFAVLMPVASFDLSHLLGTLQRDDALRIAEAIYELAVCTFKETDYAHMDIKAMNVLAFCQLTGGSITISLGDIGSFVKSGDTNSFIAATYQPPFPWLEDKVRTDSGDYQVLLKPYQLTREEMREWMLWASLIVAYDLSTPEDRPIQGYPTGELVMRNGAYDKWLEESFAPIDRLLDGVTETHFTKMAKTIVDKVRDHLRVRPTSFEFKPQLGPEPKQTPGFGIAGYHDAATNGVV